MDLLKMPIYSSGTMWQNGIVRKKRTRFTQNYVDQLKLHLDLAKDPAQKWIDTAKKDMKDFRRVSFFFGSQFPLLEFASISLFSISTGLWTRTRVSIHFSETITTEK